MGSIENHPAISSPEYAAQLDTQDPLKSFREKFIFPSKASLKSRSLSKLSSSDEPAIYFCGNSLGLQPRATREFLNAHLDTWASHAVNGHFTTLEGSPLTEWQSLAEHAAEMSSKLVGASPSEVSVQNTLTVNLHLLMASFYKPTAKKHKIILDWKAFPSDHYMFESQIRWHGFDPKSSMILVGPEEGQYILSTEKILATIDEHAEETALILLPGIQYYTGQWFEMEKITAHAHSKGLIVGWDLAHAMGNVPLELHDWNVDFAAWCNYKYMNCGPGGVGGLFVHEKHGRVDYSNGPDKPTFVDRLAGWYGGDKKTRFAMDNIWRPAPGASGWQLSTSSTVDITCLCAALSVWEETSISQVREKSLKITGYLEQLLLDGNDNDDPSHPYRIITPLDPAQRGAQLSILLKPGLLPPVFAQMQAEGFLFDQRKPDVIRIAPAPLYNSYEDVRLFVERFKAAVKVALS